MNNRFGFVSIRIVLMLALISSCLDSYSQQHFSKNQRLGSEYDLGSDLIETHDNWKWLSPFPHGGSFLCSNMVSRDTILVGGYNGHGVIYYSYDGGTTWDISDMPENVTGMIRKIRMYTGGKKGYAIQSISSHQITSDYKNTNSKLLATSDGGKTWKYEDSEVVGEKEHVIYDIKVSSELDESIKNVQPSYFPVFQSNGILTVSNHVSFDGGKTAYKLENKLTGGEAINSSATDFDGYVVYFLDENNGWGITRSESGTIGLYHTNNKGASWSPKYMFDTYYPIHILHFINPTTGWYKTSQGIYYTSNGGASWTMTSSFPEDINSFQFIDDQHGFALTGFAYNEFLYKTSDGGSSWSLIESLEEENYLEGGSLNFTILGDTVITQNHSTIRLSYDKGNDWPLEYEVNSGRTTYLSYNYAAVRFNTSKICFVMSGSGPGHFSDDGGKSFFEISTPIFYVPDEFYLINGKNRFLWYEKYSQTLRMFEYTSRAIGIDPLKVQDISYGGKKYFDDGLGLVTWEDTRDTIYLSVNYNTPYGQSMYKRSISDETWNETIHIREPGSSLGVINYPTSVSPYSNYAFNLLNENLYPYTTLPYHVFLLDKNYMLYSNNQLANIYYSDPELILMPEGSYSDWGNDPINALKSVGDTLFLVGNGIHRKVQKANAYANLGSVGAELRAVDFSTSQYGVIAGENCEIYGTINSGNFWSKYFTPSPKVSGVTGAYFISKNLGYLISSGALYKTNNGGLDWSIVSIYSFGENEKIFVNAPNTYAYIHSKSGALHKVDLGSGQVVYLAGGVKDFYIGDDQNGYYISSNSFYKTTDGGNQWDFVYNFGGVTLNAVSFANLNVGYAGGGAGKLFKTVNGGISWSDISVAGVKINGISVVSSDTVFVGGDAGTFFYSYNGGVNWQPRTTGTGDNLHHIKFFNGYEGYLVTSIGYLKTLNAGQSFEIFSAPKGVVKLPNPLGLQGYEILNLPVGNERKSSSLFVFDRSFKDFIYVNNINVLRNPEFGPENLAPTIASNMVFYIDENSDLDTSIGYIDASDANNDELTYLITSGNELGTLKVDSNTGEISIANTSPLDFETNPSFVLAIEVSDGELSETGNITILVNDINEAPTDLNLSSLTISENKPAGTIIGTLTTSDVDAGSSFTYHFSEESDAFEIVGDKLQSKVIFDFEETPLIPITITSTDQGGLTFSKAFDVTIIDVVNEVLSSRDINVEAFIYPNPVKNYLYVKWDRFETITISDLAGKKVIEANSPTVDLQNLKQGIYLVTLRESNNKEVTFRMIKE